MAKEKNKTELPNAVEGELRTRLIKLREEAGFDLSQMADALCLSEGVIANLENEAFDLLPEPPYVRGYLRNYAKLSNNDDASELINCYESLRGADASELDFHVKSSAPILNDSTSRLSPIWGQIILLGVLIAALALIYSIPPVNTWINDKWQSMSSQLQPTDARDNPSLLGDLPVPTPIEDDTEITTQDTSTDDSTTNESSAATTDSTSTENTSDESNADTTTTDTSNNTSNAETSTDTDNSAADTTETETNTDTQEIPAASEDGSINIKLVFNKEVWLRIKDKDNKTVFEGLNKADTEKTIDLVKPLTFRVGNAQGLSLFIDNKAIDITTYINGSIANFTLE